MRLVKGKDTFNTEDETVIRAYKANGYIEEKVKEVAVKATSKPKNIKAGK